MLPGSKEQVFNDTLPGFYFSVNSVAESLGPIIQPYAKDVLEKVSIFGTNKAEWQAYLRKTIPADQLPEFYGGKNPSFKPVKIYG